jgi:putative transposase
LQSQVDVSAAAEEEQDLGIDERYQVPDELWKRIQVLLPPPPKKKNKDRPGRPRMDDRKAMNAIFYILRTGMQWKALPRSLGAASTVHDRFQEWRKAGVFEKMWREALLEYDAKKGIDWEWQSMDAAITKAPLGGKRPVPIRPTGGSQERRGAC